MKRKHVVFVASLALAIAIPIGLLVYKATRTATLDAYLVDHGFTRAPCTTAIARGAKEATCYAGRLGRAAATLSFVTRLTPGYNPNASHVASRTVVVIDLTLPGGQVETRHYEEVWTPGDARERLEQLRNELAN